MALELLTSSIYGTFTTYTALQIHRRVRDPYMDEIFHVPQAQRFCAGNFTEWDDKITTLPGLYLISIGIINPISHCTTSNLRLINVLLGILCLPIFHKITKQIHGGKHYYEEKKALLSSLNLGFFPLFYFFTFIYYTDVGSTFMVLLMYSLHLGGSDWFASFIGVASVIFRQTNIVWVFFVASQAAGPILIQGAQEARMAAKNSPIKFSLTPFGQILEVIEGVGLLLKSPLSFLGLLGRILKTCFGYIICGLSFLAFVILNEGIVVGDRQAHQVVPHPTQILYFCAFSLAFSAPYAISRILPFVSFCRKHWIWLSLIVFVVVLTIKECTIAHPYLLADNRHYTFYIWRRVITRTEWTPFAITPIYVFGGFCLLYSLRRAELEFQLAFPFCVLVNLVPQYLLEFRYFVIPFILYRLQLRPQVWWKLLLELMLFVVINAITIYLFLFKPFHWPHDAENIQRFMW